MHWNPKSQSLNYLLFKAQATLTQKAKKEHPSRDLNLGRSRHRALIEVIRCISQAKIQITIPQMPSLTRAVGGAAC